MTILALMDKSSIYLIIYRIFSNRDLDGVPDAKDNCKEAPNSGQEDEDEYGKGDRCCLLEVAFFEVGLI